jgi:hypothetical protein
MRQFDLNKLPGAYRRWPVLAGVAAGFWILFLIYLGRSAYCYFRHDHYLAGLSLVWSIICLGLGQILHAWARNSPVD